MWQSFCMDLYALVAIFVATKINGRKCISCHKLMERGYEGHKHEYVYTVLKISNAYVKQL